MLFKTILIFLLLAGSAWGESIRDPSLRGTRFSLFYQGFKARQALLASYQKIRDVEVATMRREFVPVSSTACYIVDEEDVAPDRRAVRPWTLVFVQRFGCEFVDRFKRPFLITGAVRSIQFQLMLRTRDVTKDPLVDTYNAAAAPAFGNFASPHLTGMTIDIGWYKMTRQERLWVERCGLRLEALDLIEITKEWGLKSKTYHISVFPEFAWYAERKQGPICPQ